MIIKKYLFEQTLGLILLYPPSWIFHTWTFMRDNNLWLEEGTANINPQEQNNSFIMEDFISAGIEGGIMA